MEPSEFQRVSAELGFLLSDDDVAAFFSRHDKDGDGLLSIHEFGAAMQPVEGVPPRSLCRESLPNHLAMPTHENASCRERRAVRMCPARNRMVKVQAKVPAHQTSEKLQLNYQKQPQSWQAPRPPSRPANSLKKSPYASTPKLLHSTSRNGGTTKSSRPQTSRSRPPSSRQFTDSREPRVVRKASPPEKDFSYTTREEWGAMLKDSLRAQPPPPSPINERKVMAGMSGKRRPQTAGVARERRSLRPQTARLSRQASESASFQGRDPEFEKTKTIDPQKDFSYTTREEWDAMVKESKRTRPQPPSPVNERMDYALNKTVRVCNQTARAAFVPPTSRPQTSSSRISDWVGPI